ncbi:immunoglobulin-like domain-containing protein [Bacillus alkalisoli]|uniref:immunoglobulin-like domain-containing protein n=1 Tax=Bacillus alkalisoli TaxID=2011008 RepID=UPI000C236881|nr:immunoglobulin-like domain-containing protein [Bacillus alkalisoli]
MSFFEGCKNRFIAIFLSIILVFSHFGTIVSPISVSAEQTELTTVVEWNFNHDQPIATGGTESNATQEITSAGSTITGYVVGHGSNSRAINSNRWHVGEEKYWMIKFNTVGYENLSLSSKQYGSSTGPRDFQVQYSLDGQAWQNISGGDLEIVGVNTWNSIDNLSLPQEANNQETVYVRWLNTSNVSIGGNTVGSTGTNRMDDIVVTSSTAPIEVPGDDEDTEPKVLSISEARGMGGQEVTVTGVANISQGLLNSSQFSLYIQDGDAGIQLFNFNAQNFPTVEEGDFVQVTGKVGEFNNVTQIEVSTIEILESNHAVVAKNIDLSVYADAALAESYEGQLVTFEGYIRNINDYFNGGSSISIINNDFESVDIRVWESTGIDLSKLEKNAWYEITAISSQYGNTYQVLPRSSADIVKLAEQKDAPTTAYREFVAKVAAVVDGDTIRLTTPILGATNVRFLNMDTAETYHAIRNELDQHQMDHGKRAGEHLRTMIQDGDTVTLRLGSEPLDGYGRLLAEVITEDGLNTNLQMVRDGFAPTYFIYPFENDTVAEYAAALKYARENELGIWNPEDPLLEMPFVFRARERGSQLSRFVGNFETKEYVAPDHYEIIPPEYRVFFTKSQANSLGYQPLQLSDEESIDMDKNALGVEFQGTDNAENVLQDVTLITTGAYGSSISWESSNVEVISTTGIVTNPKYESVEVTLTATLQKGALQETKSFTVIVKPAIFELVSWHFNGESPVATGGIESNASQEIRIVGATGTGYVAGHGSSSRAINSNGWHNTGEEKYWFIEFSTLGYKNVTLSSKQFGSNTGPRDFVVQYSLDGTNWTEVANTNVTVGNNWTSGVLNNISLPQEVENQENVYVRWLNTSNVSINSGIVGSGGTNRMEDVVISGNEGLFNGEPVDGEDPVDEPVDTPEDPIVDNGTITVNPNVSEFENGATVEVKLSDGDITYETVKVTGSTIRQLIEKNAQLNLVTNHVNVTIPLTIFTSHLDEDVEITVEESEVEVPNKENALSKVYSFTIMQGDQRISEFEEAITLSFIVTDINQVTNTSNLEVYYLNGQVWESIGGEYLEDNGVHYVIAQTKHFSTFAIFETDEEQPIDGEEPPVGGEGPVDGEEPPVDGEEPSVGGEEPSVDGEEPTVGGEESSVDGGEEPNTEESTVNEQDTNSTNTKDKNQGEKLPNTATTLYNFLLLGAVLLLVGGAMFLISANRRMNN